MVVNETTGLTTPAHGISLCVWRSCLVTRPIGDCIDIGAFANAYRYVIFQQSRDWAGAKKGSEMALPDSLPLLMLQSREVEIALDLSDTNGTSLSVIAHKMRADRFGLRLEFA